MVEFLLTLDEVGYDGWLTLDLVPQREEVVAACAHSIHALQVYLGLIKHLDRAALRAAQADMDALKVQRLIHDMLGQGVPA